jgi:hypothetical protein
MDYDLSDEELDLAKLAEEERRYSLARDAYVSFRQSAFENGFKGDFNAAARKRCKNDSPRSWVYAAEEIASEVVYARREQDARRNGYHCALEQDWAIDAEREAYDRMHGIIRDY